MSKFYAITMPKAHLGHGRQQDITFAISAPTMLDAMDKAKKMGGVKHGKMPLRGIEISKEDYLKRREQSAYLPWYK